jgi:predicted metal-dependent phosphoesterase TrpH
MARAFVDLHCHTSASFDSLASPRDVMRAAAARGITHLAITDHDRIDGALRARDEAPEGLTVLVGEEVKTTDGDLICVFLEQPIPPGLSPAETIAAAREQGALVGIPHPFDRFRNSLLREMGLSGIASLVDWVETYNARVVGDAGNAQAAKFAREHGLPGVAVSDAHSTLEVGISYTVVEGDPSTPGGLLAALPPADLVTSRASYLVRTWTPVAKLVNAVRGNARIRPVGSERRGSDGDGDPKSPHDRDGPPRAEP